MCRTDVRVDAMLVSSLDERLELLLCAVLGRHRPWVGHVRTTRSTWHLRGTFLIEFADEVMSDVRELKGSGHVPEVPEVVDVISTIEMVQDKHDAEHIVQCKPHPTLFGPAAFVGAGRT